jgi:hypothetical protein
MKRLIIKELMLSCVVFIAGIAFFKLFGLSILVKWIIFSGALFLLFGAGTIVFFIIKKLWKDVVGLAFAGVTLLNQLILLILLFIFLEPEELNHRIVAKAGVGAYLTYLGIDTYWKLRWLFPPSQVDESQKH